jgi:hypothetical protein
LPLALCFPIAATAVADWEDALSELRLSGVILVGGEPKLAVVERAGRGGRTVRVGDTLRGVGAVTAIGPDWVRIDVGGGVGVLQLSAPAQGQSAGDDGQPSTVGTVDLDNCSVHTGSVDVTPELLSEIGRVAANPSASEEDLSLTLIPLLGLAGDARIKIFFPGEPEREEKGPAELHAALVRGEAVRLRIEQDGEEEMVYLMPEHVRPQPPPGETNE